MGKIYTQMKMLYFREKMESLPLTEDRIMPPIHIRIKPTNFCTHNCWYCAYRADNLQLGRDMERRSYIPKEKMMEIIDDIVEMGVKAVTFSGGGDPFYYPYLLDAVKKLSQTTVSFASLTNAAKLKGELAEVFANYGTWLRVSIDGWDDESYSLYRKVPKGEFTKVIKNIESFKKIGGRCHLGASIIVDKHNALKVYEFVGRLKDIGVNSVKISPCIVDNNGEENNEYHSSIFNKVKEEVKRAVEDLSEDTFEIFDSYHVLGEKFEKEYSWCPYLQILPVIGADLNIYPCQDKAYNLNGGLIGSIKDKRFKDFWFENKKKFFKINPSLVCNNHCVANMKNKMILEYLDTNKEHLCFV